MVRFCQKTYLFIHIAGAIRKHAPARGIEGEWITLFLFVGNRRTHRNIHQHPFFGRIRQPERTQLTQCVNPAFQAVFRGIDHGDRFTGQIEANLPVPQIRIINDQATLLPQPGKKNI